MPRLYLDEVVEADNGFVGTVTFIHEDEVSNLPVYSVTDENGVTNQFYLSELKVHT